MVMTSFRLLLQGDKMWIYHFESETINEVRDKPVSIMYNEGIQVFTLRWREIKHLKGDYVEKCIAKELKKV